jgi:hypothetical protein
MYFEAPVPGGRHDLVEDTPIDPNEELARLRAHLGMPVLPPSDGLDAESDPVSPPAGEGDWVPLRSSWQPSAQTWKPLAERWGQEQTDPEPDREPVVPPPTFPSRPASTGPVVLTQTVSEPEPPAPAAAPPTDIPVTSQPDPAPRRAWPLLPLVWFNAAFDLLLVPWGPAGRWLRRPSGRAFLGIVGILCLLGAAALAIADAVGWNW